MSAWSLGSVASCLSILAAALLGCGGGGGTPANPPSSPNPPPGLTPEPPKVVDSTTQTSTGSAPLTFQLGNASIEVSGAGLEPGTVVTLQQLAVPKLLEGLVVGQPFAIQIPSKATRTPDIHWTLELRGLPQTAAVTDFDLIGFEGNISSATMEFAWATLESGVLRKSLPYAPGYSFFILDQTKLSAGRHSSSDGLGIPLLESLHGPRPLNLVFVHGLDIRTDLFSQIPLQRTSHWAHYIDPAAAPASTHPLALLFPQGCNGLNENVAIWHFYYNTMKPIFGSNGNGAALARQIESQILMVEPEATIILHGYSMGALVSLAAYDALGPAQGQVAKLLTLHGANAGTEWVNLALTGDFWMLPFPRTPGILDLRSPEKFEYMTDPDIFGIARTGVADFPHPELRRLRTAYAAQLANAPRARFFPTEFEEDNFIGSNFDGAAWTTGFHLPAAGVRLTPESPADSLLLGADALFRSITLYHLEDEFGGSRLALAGSTGLYGPHLVPLHDGILPLYSQLGLDVAADYGAPWVTPPPETGFNPDVSTFPSVVMVDGLEHSDVLSNHAFMLMLAWLQGSSHRGFMYDAIWALEERISQDTPRPILRPVISDITGPTRVFADLPYEFHVTLNNPCAQPQVQTYIFAGAPTPASPAACVIGPGDSGCTITRTFADQYPNPGPYLRSFTLAPSFLDAVPESTFGRFTKVVEVCTPRLLSFNWDENSGQRVEVNLELDECADWEAFDIRLTPTFRFGYQGDPEECGTVPPFTGWPEQPGEVITMPGGSGMNLIQIAPPTVPPCTRLRTVTFKVELVSLAGQTFELLLSGATHHYSAE